LLSALGLLILGTGGFIVFKHQDPFSAFFTTVELITTHFYDPGLQSTQVKILILLLSLGGIFLVAYLIKWFADYIIEGELRGGWQRSRMNKKIASLEGHTIICGFGRVGQQVAEEFAHQGQEFIVTDRDPARVEQAQTKGYLVVAGDAVHDNVLEEAGVERAKVLVATVGNDTDNVFITLAARSYSPTLFIVARANREDTVSKLEKAGANRVAQPYQVGGYHMATMALQPAVVDFLDFISNSKSGEMRVEEMLVAGGSHLVGKPLGLFLSRRKTGTTVLVINRPHEDPIVNPDADEILKSGDKLLVMGTREQLDAVAG
jgi:voltage-gated potassium channel